MDEAFDGDMTWPPGGKSTSFAVQFNRVGDAEFEHPGFGFGLYWADKKNQMGPYITLDIWRWSFQAGWLRW
jgi:hypothetical protein